MDATTVINREAEPVLIDHIPKDSGFGNARVGGGRFQYLDILRIFATFFVILLHCIDPYITNVQLVNTKTWWFCIFANAIARTGVPSFFMISGCLLLNSAKTMNFADFYKRRFSRILVPFLAWDIIYFIFFGMIQDRKNAIDFFKELFVSGSSYHFWFVYTLIGIYLFMPFLKRIVDNCTNKHLLWLLTIILFTGTIRPFINTVTPFYIYLFDPLMEGYIGYVVLGYVLGRLEMGKKARILVYLGGLAGFLLGVIGNSVNSSQEQINLLFNGGYQINNLLCATSLFVFLKHLKPLKGPKTTATIAAVSRVTYAVFLMHVLALDIIHKHFTFLEGIYMILFSSTVCFVICLCVMLVVSKIKYLNKALL